MNLRVFDISPRHVELGGLSFEDIDLVVVGCGYEERCQFLTRTLVNVWGVDPVDLGRKLLVLDFDDLRDLPGRRRSDEFFGALSPRYRIEASKDSPFVLRDRLLELARRSLGRFRVVVDYSAMPRFWYLPLVPLLRIVPDLVLHYCYALGDYGDAKSAYPVSAVGRVQGVPGLEGLHQTRPRFYVLGLGYDGAGTRALVRQLEIQRYAVFWAAPGASPDAAEIAQDRNRDLVENAALRFSSPLHDIVGLCSLLRRIAHETQLSDKLVLVPVGPKPHVLACGIVAAEYSHVTLLAPHFSGGGIRRDHPNVTASGEVVCCTVSASPRP